MFKNMYFVKRQCPKKIENSKKKTKNTICQKRSKKQQKPQKNGCWSKHSFGQKNNKNNKLAKKSMPKKIACPKKHVWQKNDQNIIQKTMSKKSFKKYQWPIIDVTRKSVEETAASVLKIHDIFNQK